MSEVKTVTAKKPGRVEAGKKLAEWNRQKKLNQKTKQNIISDVEESPKLPEVTKTEQTDRGSKSSFLSSGRVISVAVVVGGGGYMLYKLWQSRNKAQERPKQERLKPAKVEQTVKKPTAAALPVVDSFHME